MGRNLGVGGCLVSSSAFLSRTSALSSALNSVQSSLRLDEEVPYLHHIGGRVLVPLVVVVSAPASVLVVPGTGVGGILSVLETFSLTVLCLRGVVVLRIVIPWMVVLGLSVVRVVRVTQMMGRNEVVAHALGIWRVGICLS